MQTENSPLDLDDFVRDVHYVLVCGVIWQRNADLVAGWELIRALNSEDLYLREIAKQILVACGQPSMKLLESAFAKGSVTPDSAGECIAEIFRAQSREVWTSWEQPNN